MSIAQDFIYDKALELFAETQECSDTSCYQQRMILEELPCIIKSSVDLIEDNEVHELLNHYYEEIMDLFQLVASDLQDNDSISNSMQKLKLSTIKVIKIIKQKIESPFVQNAFEFHQRRLKEKLGEYLDTDSTDESDISCGENFDENIHGIMSQLEEPSVNDSAISASCSVTNTEISENEKPDNNLKPADSVNLAPSTDSENTKIECNLIDLDTNFDNPPVNEGVLAPATVGVEESKVEEVSDCLPLPTQSDVAESSIGNDSIVLESEINTSAESSNTSIPTISSDSSGTSTNVHSLANDHHQPKRKQRHNFSVESDCMLIHGFWKYSGFGDKWTKIYRNYKFPSYRKPSHLKDRWRTLTDNGIVKMEQNEVNIFKDDLAVAYKRFVDNLPSPKKAPIPMVTLPKRSSSAQRNSSSPFKTSIRTRSVANSEQASPASTRKKERSSPKKSPSSQEPAQMNSQPHFVNESPRLSSSGPRTRSSFNSPSPRKATEQSPSKTSKAIDAEAKSSKDESQSFPMRKRRRRLWEGDGVALTWDGDDDFPQPPKSPQTSSVTKTHAKSHYQRHRKKPWRHWEIANLLKGIRRYGVGQWAMIQDQFQFCNRNPVMLKDKYRNMLKNHELPDDLL